MVVYLKICLAAIHDFSLNSSLTDLFPKIIFVEEVLSAVFHVPMKLNIFLSRILQGLDSITDIYEHPVRYSASVKL